MDRGQPRPSFNGMSSTGKIALAVIAAVALSGSTAFASDRYDRAFRWSGQHWTVRKTDRRADPGHNLWGDSRNNVRARRDGSLRLNIVRGRSVDVVGPRTGYGRYRWIVDSDVSAVHAFRVIAFFVQGRNGECDLEFSRWGEPLSATPGSWVTWRRGVRTAFAMFAATPAPPYTVVIDWRVGTTRFAVRDAAGAMLLDTTVRSARPGRHAAPHMSYWLYPGHGTQLSPVTVHTVHPPVVVRSFRYRAAQP